MPNFDQDMAVSELPGITSSDLSMLKIVYGLCGRFEFGLPFDPHIVPLSHMIKLLPLCINYFDEVGSENLKECMALYTRLSGEELDLKSVKRERQQTERASEPAAPRAPKTEVEGVDYAAVVNELTERAA